jgi:hypothetical protein
MTQDERLPGREKDAGMVTGLIHRYYRIFTASWKFPVPVPFLKPELSPEQKHANSAGIESTSYGSQICHSTSTPLLPCDKNEKKLNNKK